MMSMNWNYPTTIWFGNQRINEIQKACESLNIRKPLIVTDPGILKTNIIEKINSSLVNKSNIFSEVQSNPTGNNVELGVSYFNSNSHDGVIAVGGGSGMDVGKGIAFMAGQDRPLWDFEDIGDHWKRADESKISPIIAIPTTAGTGSETGRASVIVNEETGIKKIIFHPKFMPTIVILDPVLTIDLPPRITAATGMDALAHNLEAFCAPGFHPMADGIALEGMRLIKNSLSEAVRNGNNILARSEMLTAASMGSTAFQKGLGAIHSLSHPINAQFNIHHGLSNAIFMPYVLTFNKKEVSDRIISICDYLGLDKSFDNFVKWIMDLREELNIPHKLSDVIDTEKMDLDKLSEMAYKDPSTGGNPKKLTKSDMKSMYQHSISGELF